MFNFALILLPDGNQIINERVKTPYESLTAKEMMEYKEVEDQLFIMAQLKKEREEKRKRRNKIRKNPLWKLGYILGVITW